MLDQEPKSETVRPAGRPLPGHHADTARGTVADAAAEGAQRRAGAGSKGENGHAALHRDPKGAGQKGDRRVNQNNRRADR